MQFLNVKLNFKVILLVYALSCIAQIPLLPFKNAIYLKSDEECFETKVGTQACVYSQKTGGFLSQ